MSAVGDFLNFITPNFIRDFIKKRYWGIRYKWNKIVHIKKKKLVSFGRMFRFTRRKPFGANLGEKTAIDDFNFWSCNAGDINIGKRCWFGLFNTMIGPVEMGDNVSTGPNVTILGPHHAVFRYVDKYKDKAEENEKTVIGNNVWISAGAIILFGITIGDNAIIGPGAVVTKDVLPDSYVAGNPARDLTKITQFGNLIGKIKRH